MRFSFGFLLVVGLSGTVFGAEEPFCKVLESCVADRFALRFPATGTAEISGVHSGDEIELEVLLDVKSRIQGLSYSVTHDPAVLTILSATSKVELPVDFKVTRVSAGKLGFLQTIVVSQDSEPPLELPLGDGLLLAGARYLAEVEPPRRGTRIVFSAPRCSPGGLCFGFVIGGEYRLPLTVVNGVVRGEGAGPLAFSRGDANGDSRISLSDVILILGRLFGGRPAAADCDDASDANDDGEVDVSDPVVLASYLYLGTAPPPPPFRACGDDPVKDTLGCNESSCP